MSTQNEILRKLEIISQLLAMNLFKDVSSTEQIDKLNNLGFTNKEIANIVGKSENNVRATLSNLGKSTKIKKPKESKETENE